jgi:hypothetical protein
MAMTDPIMVNLEAGSDPQVRRAFAILQDRLQQRGAGPVVETQGSDAQVILATANHLPPEAFRIESAGAAVRVVGGSARGLLYGVGKLLRTSQYDGHFRVSPWRGTSVPRGSLRGMYLANHFHNWYHLAEDAEIVRYTEDLALWGVNAIMTGYPMINLRGWDDPEAGPALAQVRRLFRAAKDLGLETVIGVGNVLFNSAPAELRATPLPDPSGRHGNSGTTVCPSLAGGRDLILQTTRTLLEQLAEVGLDYICIWPYDEGGCACERCRPWGGNGFIRMSRDIAAAGRAVLPNLKIILSTWTFDTPPEGEWQALTEALARDGGWADVILADAHEDFPRYPLDTGVPGNLPLINFPEISMWGNWPWGGCGAHPLPARLQRLWDQAKAVVRGGFPYSEGIYEDINKAIASQFYWDPDRAALETLREYADYEFSPAVSADVLALVADLEAAAGRHYQKLPAEPAAAERAARLAEALQARLPAWARAGWRWEILLLRARLDRERFAGDGLQTPAAEAAMLRLVDIYHCQMDTDDPYHHRVRPPLRQATSRRGQC